MSRLTAAVGVFLVCVAWLIADDKPTAKPDDTPSRAEQFKAIQTDYQTARDDLFKTIRAGKVEAAKDGSYPELAELQKRFADRARKFIDANPKDEVALDAILFSMRDLVADASDANLYELLMTHHLGSPKLGTLVGRPWVPDKFLYAVITKSPHSEVRGRATLALAAHLAHGNRANEAEPLLEKIMQEQATLKKGAEALLYEIRHLRVGKVVPEVEGWDRDDQPMKLSEYRGKAVMLVFWATWCGPCMAMVPHERELAKRYAGRPFAIVGVNGDADSLLGAEGKQVDNKARVAEIIKQEQINWRSFKDYSRNEKMQLSQRWNVHEWPTVFLVDHQGVIRHRFRGVPEEKELDTALEKLVVAVEADQKKLDKK